MMEPQHKAYYEDVLKAINSSSSYNQWVAHVNEAVETGKPVVAPDNSYTLYAEYQTRPDPLTKVVTNYVSVSFAW